VPSTCAWQRAVRVIALALVLVSGCTKTRPVELRTRELPGCGPIAELTEVGGRLYGVSDQPMRAIPPPGIACAFDIDAQLEQPRVDSLTWDAHPIVGGNAQLVDADGVQTVIASWLTDEGRRLHVGILRRTPAGLEQLDSVVHGESIIPSRKLDAGWVGDRVVVGFTRRVHNASCGESYEEPVSHWIWRVGDELKPIPDLGTAERLTSIGDDLLVAGISSDARGDQAVYEVRVQRAADPNSEPRWVAQLRPRDGEARPERVLDLEILGDSVYVLTQGKDRVWLSRVATDTGAIAWSLVGDGIVGELSSTLLGKVQVTTLVRHENEPELRWFEVDEAGESGPTRTAALAIASNVVITTITNGEDGRVWLGGYVDLGGEDWSTSWIGVATIDR
jgi:hypothetical protein